MRTVLTIAGSDPSGGAGIQADLKTFAVHNLYGMSAVTALTVQNTTGVFDVLETKPDIVAAQIDAVFSDIFPDAVKIGMVSNRDIIAVIADKLRRYGARNVVLDPVMVATSGGALLHRDAVRALIELLLPLADIVTPNIPEATVLSGTAIESQADMERAAAGIAAHFDGHILIKGGHREEDSDDLLWHNCAGLWLRGKRIKTNHTHGTGCTLSSAIACGLANGKTMAESVAAAKDFVSGALRYGLRLGRGNGPLHHGWNL